MAKPWIHAVSSAKRFGGIPEDYIAIHDLLDSSKAAFPDNRHRALTHNSWFIFVVEKVFGHTLSITCPGGRGTAGCPVVSKTDFECFICRGSGLLKNKVSVRDVCEQHILEDFGGKYIPTPQDYLEHMDFQPWLNNGIGGAPSSHKKLVREGGHSKVRVINFD